MSNQLQVHNSGQAHAEPQPSPLLSSPISPAPSDGDPLGRIEDRLEAKIRTSLAAAVHSMNRRLDQAVKGIEHTLQTHIDQRVQQIVEAALQDKAPAPKLKLSTQISPKKAINVNNRLTPLKSSDPISKISARCAKKQPQKGTIKTHRTARKNDNNASGTLKQSTSTLLQKQRIDLAKDSPHLVDASS